MTLDPAVPTRQSVGVTTSFIPPETARDRARPELVWFLRHQAALQRWPVISEPWAQQVEERRLTAQAERQGNRPHP
jgi:hypothetical protein